MMKVMFLPFWCWISYPFFNRFWRCLWLWWIGGNMSRSLPVQPIRVHRGSSHVSPHEAIPNVDHSLSPDGWKQEPTEGPTKNSLVWARHVAGQASTEEWSCEAANLSKHL
jgi:hypothetical protein